MTLDEQIEAVRHMQEFASCFEGDEDSDAITAALRAAAETLAVVEWMQRHAPTAWAYYKERKEKDRADG